MANPCEGEPQNGEVEMLGLFETIRWIGGATSRFLASLLIFALTPGTIGPAKAESIKIGLVKAPLDAAVLVAVDKGYFAAEGLEPKIRFLPGGEPIAVATVSGDIDYGVAALTAGFYSLAGKGALRIIAGSFHEARGFHDQALVASRDAFTSGLTGARNFPGHTLAVTQIGSPPHYALALIAEKYGFDPKSVRLMPFQSIPNEFSAVMGGKADATMVPSALALPAIGRGDVKLLAWIDDEVSWQLAAVFTSAKKANGKSDEIAKFLRAYRRGVRDYYDAFTGPGETRRDGSTALEIEKIIATGIGQSSENVAKALAYIDAKARLDVKDVLHQIAWYRAQGMIKGEVPSDLVDNRYVVALPER